MTHDEKFPLITVITATYKKFDRVYETIASVLEQDYPRIEYIICDDGSPNFPEDEINAYVKEHGKENIDFKILKQPKNVGTVRNLNAGFKNSIGTYVTNVSAGDSFFTHDVISKIVDVIKKHHPSLIATSRLLFVGEYEPLYMLPHYEERSILAQLKTAKSQYKALVLNRFYDMASGSALVFSREILEKIGYFDESYMLWEDGPFITKYLLQDKLYMAYDIISIWYEDGGVSAKGNKQIHPLLKKDIQKYDSGERIRHIDFFSESEKRLVDYQMKINKKNSKLERVFLFISYFPQMLSNRNYIKKRNARIAKDHEIIKNIMKEGNKICK
ncbi:MAG: glycosyltransferase [Ruminococcus sp.]|jgi:GT2 family glycosyltransferase|nr:glycosyltransferase [Ruminococcus sp.]